MSNRAIRAQALAEARQAVADARAALAAALDEEQDRQRLLDEMPPDDAPMRSWQVHWEVDVDAPDEIAAARMAFAIMQRRRSPIDHEAAVVFDVTAASGASRPTSRIDLALCSHGDYDVVHLAHIRCANCTELGAAAAAHAQVTRAPEGRASRQRHEAVVRRARCSSTDPRCPCSIHEAQRHIVMNMLCDDEAERVLHCNFCGRDVTRAMCNGSALARCQCGSNNLIDPNTGKFVGPSAVW